MEVTRSAGAGASILRDRLESYGIEFVGGSLTRCRHSEAFRGHLKPIDSVNTISPGYHFQDTCNLRVCGVLVTH